MSDVIESDWDLLLSETWPRKLSGQNCTIYAWQALRAITKLREERDRLKAELDRIKNPSETAYDRHMEKYGKSSRAMP